MTAAKVVQRIASFSCASLSHALMLPRGMAWQLHRRFLSLSGKNGKAAVKVDLENRRIDANHFINKTKLNLADVGNSLTVATMISPSTGILKQTTIVGARSRLICLDMKATTSAVPRVLDAMLSVSTGLYGNPYSCTHTYGWEITKAIDVARPQLAKLIGGHPNEIGKLCLKNRVSFCTHAAQSVGNGDKWDDDLTSIAGPKVYGPKDIRPCYIHHRQKVRIDSLMSGSGQERSLCSGTHTHPLEFAFREPYRISQEENEYTRTSKPFFSQNSICSSTMQDNNYIHKRHHPKQPKEFTRTFWTMGHHKADMEKSKPKTTTEDSRVGIQEDNLKKEVHDTKAKKNTDKKKKEKPPVGHSVFESYDSRGGGPVGY